MKRSIFYVTIIVFALFQAVQACTLLFDEQELYNLSTFKNKLKNIQFEDVIFESFLDANQQQTLQRRGILVKKPQAIGTVIICHGYLGCKRDAIALKHLFPQYNVFTFDFRAHGDDRQGQVSTIGRDEAFDVIAAVNFIKSHDEFKCKPVIAYGYSMGAVSAIQAQAMDNTLFDAMILDCPYDSTDRAMSRGLDEKMKINIFGTTFMLPGKQFILNHMYDEAAQTITNFLFQAITKLDSNKVVTKFVRVAPVESIKKITVPCYFIHCVHDKKVPVQAVVDIYENKEGFKRLWLTQGKGHFGSYQNNPELYWYKVNKFLTKLRQQDLDSRVQARIRDDRVKPESNHDFGIYHENQKFLQIDGLVIESIEKGEWI